MSALDVALVVYVVGLAPAVPVTRWAIRENRKSPDSNWSNVSGLDAYAAAFLLVALWPLVFVASFVGMAGMLILGGLDDEPRA